MTGVTAAELASHRFVHGLSAAQITRLAEAASAVAVPAGHRFFDEGTEATAFWLIRTGHVALDLHVPGRAPILVETLGAGDVAGLSWASPPREWQFGAVAVEETEAFELNAAAVTRACDNDPALGYALMSRLMAVAAQRMHSSRIRMLDLYGAPERSAGTS